MRFVKGDGPKTFLRGTTAVCVFCAFHNKGLGSLAKPWSEARGEERSWLKSQLWSSSLADDCAFMRADIVLYCGAQDMQAAH